MKRKTNPNFSDVECETSFQRISMSDSLPFSGSENALKNENESGFLSNGNKQMFRWNVWKAWQVVRMNKIERANGEKL